MDIGTVVKPTRSLLTHTGCVWESMLLSAGWDAVASEARYGVVVAAFSDGTLDVFFPVVKHLATSVFPAEVTSIERRRDTQLKAAEAWYDEEHPAEEGHDQGYPWDHIK